LIILFVYPIDPGNGDCYQEIISLRPSLLDYQRFINDFALTIYHAGFLKINSVLINSLD